MSEITDNPNQNKVIEFSKQEEQNDLTIFFNQDQFTIIKQYRKIHRFLFKHGIYVVMLFLGVVSAVLITHFPHTLPSLINHDEKEREHLVAQSENDNLPPNATGLNIEILYGKLTLQKSTISSIGNLVNYQGIILPRIAEISTTKPLFDIEKFTQQQSSPSDIEKLVQQLIIAPGTKSTTLTKNATLTLEEGIIQDFNLQCLGERKLSDIVCDKFLSTFLDYGKLYNIQDYPQDLQTIQQSLKKEEYWSNQFCSLIYEHTKYYRQNDDTLSAVMQQCSPTQWQRYKELSDFIAIEQGITNSIISSTTYTNPSLNTYKLLSLQQVLYKNLQAGNPNRNFIMNYLTYSQDLINKSNGIAPLYKDLLYRFNTNIFRPKIETSNTHTISKTEISQILDQIDMLHKGNPMLGDKGLENMLTTEGLVQKRSLSGVETTVRDINELITALLEMKDTIKIQRTTIAPDEQSVDFNLEIFSTKILTTVGDTIKAKITMERKGDVLYIQSFSLINFADLTTFLQNNLQGKNTTLSQLVGEINQNIEFYYEPPTDAQSQKTFCELITEAAASANILKCTPTTLDLFKDGINYTFSLNNEVLTNVTISDKNLEKQVKDKLQEFFITKTNTLDYIEQILQIKREVEQETYTQERILINERMTLYLNIVPEIENVNATTFIVTFKLGDITLRGTYDLPTHTISNISFVVNEKETLLIRGLTLTLNAENR